MSSVKKLIEVSIPLKEINEACVREKSIRHGHPSTLHLWWARRPLAAARSVIFCQMVDDPSGYVDELMASPLRKQGEGELQQNAEMGGDTSQSIEEWLVETERERLHELVRELVIWENSTNEELFKRAHDEIVVSWKRHCRREGLDEATPLPAFHDPFAGGGAIPLEAQRLGLESHASDLNPVAVTINKAMIEIPPKFAGLPPVNPEANEGKLTTQTWKGAQGLAEDVRYYGNWMKEQAKKKIGHLYPPVEITSEMVKERPDLKQYEGQRLTVIAWLWARTVKSPNPAFQDKDTPLISNFIVSSKKGKEAHIAMSSHQSKLTFKVVSGLPENVKLAKRGTRSGTRGANFTCAYSSSPISGDYIKQEGQAGRMSETLIACVLEGNRGRVFLSPSPGMEETAKRADVKWKPNGKVPAKLTGGTCVPYGLTEWADLFTNRQLLALTTFCDLIIETRHKIVEDLTSCSQHSLHSSERTAASLANGGTSIQAYAEAASVYLGFAIDKLSDSSSSITSWSPLRDTIRNTFSRQAIPMVWDFAEINPISLSAGNFGSALKWIEKCLEHLPSNTLGLATQENASTQTISRNKIVSTDPPYYDNIAYADLSDYFYAWMRKSQADNYPQLYSTMSVPKSEELVAAAYRHGGKKEAEVFFMEGMTKAIGQLSSLALPNYPVSIYYAFKQAEISKEGTSSTGWVTFLEAVIKAGFGITGTWPVRTEREGRSIGVGANALASSVVLVCRRKEKKAQMATRREFVQALQREIPEALQELQQAALAPVDVPQASIGPGMAIYSRYSRVVEPDGTNLSVRTALQLINEAVDEFLSEQESEMDDWTRFAVTWFSQHGFSAGPFGDAQNIATARAISVEGVVDAGIITSSAGKVAIIKPDALDGNWDPTSDNKLTVWEITHHLIRKLAQAGEDSAAILIKQVGSSLAEDSRKLAYRLYQLCETNSWSQDAQGYNELVTLFPRLKELSHSVEAPEKLEQTDLI